MGIPMYPLFPDKPGCGGRVVVFSCTTQARPKRYTIEWMQANRERERQDPHGGIDHGPSWLLILKVILLIVAVA